jgi:hypothetical protein
VIVEFICEKVAALHPEFTSYDGNVKHNLFRRKTQDGKFSACLIFVYVSCGSVFVCECKFQNRLSTRKEPGIDGVMFCNWLLQEPCFFV